MRLLFKELFVGESFRYFSVRQFLERLSEKKSFDLILLMLLGSILFYPTLITGFYFDDSINTGIRFSLQMEGRSLWVALRDVVQHWITQEGRFYPLASLGIAFFYYFVEPLSYHAIILLFVIASLMAFVGWLKSSRITYEQTLLVILIFMMLPQIRAYHDPLTSYAGFLPVSAVLGFGSLWAMTAYQQGSEKYQLLLSSSLYLLVLLIYEVNLCFLIPLLLTVQAGKRWRAFWAPFGITLAYLAITFYLRWAYPPQYAGTQIVFGIRAIRAYLYQVSAGLPLLYPIFGRSGLYDVTTVLQELLSVKTFGVFLFTLFVMIYFLIKIARSSGQTGIRNSISWSAWALFLIPGAIIAITPKYQDEITRPGQGYLPVYLSYFGTALLLGAYFIRKMNKRNVIGIAILGSVVMTLTFTTNLLAARNMNHIWKDPREVLEKYLQSGIAKEVLKDKEMVNLTDQYWLNSLFVLQHGKIKTRIVHRNQVTKETSKGKLLLNFDTLSPDLGWVTLTSFDGYKGNTLATSGPIRFWIYSHPGRPTNLSQLKVKLSQSREIPLSSLKVQPIVQAPHWSFIDIDEQVEDALLIKLEPVL